MGRYKYSQESGTDFKVVSPDKADAQEDTNEVRQILDDLGNLLGHSKRDDLYPKNGTSGGNIDTRRVTIKSGACTLTVAEAGLILVSASAPYTIGLPTAVGNLGLTYKIVKTDFNYNLITLDAFNAQTLNYPCAAGTPQLTYARLNTGGAEVIIVSDNSNWQVINEAMGQVPMCKVYGGITDITSGSWTTVILDTEVYDIGSNFNTGTYTFTVPVPGKYHIICKFNWTSSSIVADKGYGGGVYVGEDRIQADWKQSSIASFDLTNTVDDIYSFSKDDAITAKVYHNAGVNTIDLQSSIAFPLIIRLISKD